MELSTYFYANDGDQEPPRDLYEDLTAYRILRMNGRSHTVGSMLFVVTLRINEKYGTKAPEAP
jgi:hypothetical protein